VTWTPHRLWCPSEAAVFSIIMFLKFW